MSIWSLRRMRCYDSRPLSADLGIVLERLGRTEGRVLSFVPLRLCSGPPPPPHHLFAPFRSPIRVNPAKAITYNTHAQSYIAFLQILRPSPIDLPTDASSPLKLISLLDPTTATSTARAQRARTQPEEQSRAASRSSSTQRRLRRYDGRLVSSLG